MTDQAKSVMIAALPLPVLAVLALILPSFAVWFGGANIAFAACVVAIMVGTYGFAWAVWAVPKLANHQPQK